MPLFFVLMGIQVHLGSLADPTALGLGAALVVAAILGKLACALGVLDRSMNRLAVAIGMIPRGEVGLIFAGIGASLQLGGAPVLSQGVVLGGRPDGAGDDPRDAARTPMGLRTPPGGPEQRGRHRSPALDTFARSVLTGTKGPVPVHGPRGARIGPRGSTWTPSEERRVAMTPVTINGRRHDIDLPADTPLLWALRDELGLTGTKFGCGMALCGACTVHLEGQAVRSCMTPLSAVGEQEGHHHRGHGGGPGRQGRADRLDRDQRPPVRLLPVRTDHVGDGAPQAQPEADRRRHRRRHGGNICRCGTYTRIRTAVKQAAGLQGAKS